MAITVEMAKMIPLWFCAHWQTQSWSLSLNSLVFIIWWQPADMWISWSFSNSETHLIGLYQLSANSWEILCSLFS